MPPYTVLKLSKADERHMEVAGEFPDEAGAHKFAEDCRSDDQNCDYDYIVEPPPSALGGLSERNGALIILYFIIGPCLCVPSLQAFVCELLALSST